MTATTLFRPVGLRELELIVESGWTKFPPRLPDQPIFYPVLNFAYAERIAREWNTTSDSFAGFVTSFDVDSEFLKRYEVQVVGNSTLQELWVPAEELDEFNAHIVGTIRVDSAYYGEQFEGEIDEKTNLPPHIASHLLTT
jgi:hypothetical protein